MNNLITKYGALRFLTTQKLHCFGCQRIVDMQVFTMTEVSERGREEGYAKGGKWTVCPTCGDKNQVLASQLKRKSLERKVVK